MQRSSCWWCHAGGALGGAALEEPLMAWRQRSPFVFPLWRSPWLRSPGGAFLCAAPQEPLLVLPARAPVSTCVGGALHRSAPRDIFLTLVIWYVLYGRYCGSGPCLWYLLSVLGWCRIVVGLYFSTVVLVFCIVAYVLCVWSRSSCTVCAVWYTLHGMDFVFCRVFFIVC